MSSYLASSNRDTVIVLQSNGSMVSYSNTNANVSTGPDPNFLNQSLTPLATKGSGSPTIGTGYFCNYPPTSTAYTGPYSLIFDRASCALRMFAYNPSTGMPVAYKNLSLFSTQSNAVNNLSPVTIPTTTTIVKVAIYIPSYVISTTQSTIILYVYSYANNTPTYTYFVGRT
jgi:hypothetical protein